MHTRVVSHTPHPPNLLRIRWIRFIYSYVVVIMIVRVMLMLVVVVMVVGVMMRMVQLYDMFR